MGEGLNYGAREEKSGPRSSRFGIEPSALCKSYVGSLGRLILFSYDYRCTVQIDPTYPGGPRMASL